MSSELALSQVIRKLLIDTDKAFKLEQIYTFIEENFTLSAFQKEFTRYREPRFHHEVRAIINQLLQKGEIIRVSRGKYRKS